MIFTPVTFVVAVALCIGSAVATPMPAQLEARTGSFAAPSPALQKAALAFLASAPESAILGAAAGGSSAKTFLSSGGFHLDRQQPTSSTFQSKVAIQLNSVAKGAASTVGQVVVPLGFNPPASTIIAKLKLSIQSNAEQTIVAPKGKGPAQSPPTGRKGPKQPTIPNAVNPKKQKPRELDHEEEGVHLNARAGSFAAPSPALQKAALAFLASAPESAILGAAAGGSSAKTFLSSGGFHLDRQQPTSSTFQSKVAIQLNSVAKGAASTVGQVVVPLGFNPPVSTIIAKMKLSIQSNAEQTIVAPKGKGPAQSPPTGRKGPKQPTIPNAVSPKKQSKTSSTASSKKPREIEFEERDVEERGFEEED